ncbi:MAG: glycosyltransferase family 2 protein [bacterium]
MESEVPPIRPKTVRYIHNGSTLLSHISYSPFSFQLMIPGTIIIVTYNSREQVEKCLTPILSLIHENIPVIVVDNASEDRTAEIVRDKFPQVKVLAQNFNLGFSGGVNKGAEEIQGEWLLILNPDVIISARAVRGLVQYLIDHPQVGCVGPQIRDLQGHYVASVYPFYTPCYAVLEAIGLGWWVRWRYWRRISRKVRSEHKPQLRVDRLLGAILMVRRSCWEELKGFDNRFFLYAEEEDFCYRLYQKGWEVHYLPSVEAIHIGGASAKENLPLVTASVNWSRYLWIEKQFGRGASEIIRWIWILGLAVRLGLYSGWFLLFGIVPILRREEQVSKVRWKGYWWAIRSLIKPGYFELYLRPGTKNLSKSK